LFSANALILLGVPPLVVYNPNSVAENGDFRPLSAKISRKRYVIARDLHTRTAIARIPLRQLGFFVTHLLLLLFL